MIATGEAKKNKSKWTKRAHEKAFRTEILSGEEEPYL